MRRVSAVWAVALLLTASIVAAARTPVSSSKSIASKRAVSSASTGNQKPLIGILTQPCHYCPGKSYVAAGYVKLIEMAGGRAVPVRFYASDEELRRLFKSINGLIFPGGLTWLWLDSPYVLAARKLWTWAKEENDAGNPFPIHGTCLGHQLLHILESNVSRNYLLVDTDSVAHPTTLEFTGEPQKPCRYQSLSRSCRLWLLSAPRLARTRCLCQRQLWAWASPKSPAVAHQLHCLQVLVCMAAQRTHVQTSSVNPADQGRHPCRLPAAAADAATSRFFGGIAPDLKQKLSDPTLNIALENHMYGIPPSFFDRWPILKETYTIISTTKDRNGTEYVSTVENKKYPFTGACSPATCPPSPMQPARQRQSGGRAMRCCQVVGAPQALQLSGARQSVVGRPGPTLSFDPTGMPHYTTGRQLGASPPAAK